MDKHTGKAGAQRTDGEPQAVCAWCGRVIRSAATKAAKRMCQTCFEGMMREHSRMVKDHQEAVSLYQRQSTRGTTADLRSFASATLPALQEHLSMARSMAGGSGGGSMNHNGNTNSGGAANANGNSNR